MRKKKILLHTNPTWIKTGLAENAKTLLKYLWSTNKYEIVHYCSQVSVADGNLSLSPWKSYGCIPNDPNIVNELNRDPHRARNVSYGSHNIDEVIKLEKPDIYLASDDIWAVTKADYIDKPWYKKINPILHITIDSLPILDQAFEQASDTKHYLTWAKFAKKEMHRVSPKFSHVDQIYGAMDTDVFSPITKEEKSSLRKRFGIDEDTKIFLFVFRNQLRKSENLCLEAFAKFKKENPNIKAKLYLHTCFAEKQSWDIPKMTAYYGINPNDILATYVCRKCKNWFISAYGGEEKDCPICQEKKSVFTVNIGDGVPGNQMKYIYGISDACLSIFTSGGQEYHSVQSLLCGKPLACTNYSCGEDFCEQPFVTSIDYKPYHEVGTNFIKATSNVDQIKKFMRGICKKSPSELDLIGKRGREWAVKTFGIETIGKKWEDLFDSMPEVDWENVSLEKEQKNANFPFLDVPDEIEFIKSLYKNILLMDESPQSDGFKHWLDKLHNGVTRKAIYDYFIDVANKDNAQNSGPKDFGEILEKTGKKRGLILIKESIGDILMTTALFESFHDQHPDTDLYVSCDPKFKDLLMGNPHVYKVIDYHPSFEQEMLMIGVGQKEGYFDYYYHPAIQAQRVLSYLSHPEPSFEINR